MISRDPAFVEIFEKIFERYNKDRTVESRTKLFSKKSSLKSSSNELFRCIIFTNHEEHLKTTAADKFYLTSSLRVIPLRVILLESDHTVFYDAIVGCLSAAH